MIKVIARTMVKEDKIADFKKNVAIMAPVTRKEKGCISYLLLQDSRDSKVFIFLEEWESQDALFTHLASKHVKDFEKEMQGAFEKDLEVNICSLVF